MVNKAKSESVLTDPIRRRKPPKSAWKPGQSGNPNGRPKRVDLLSRAYKHMLGMPKPDDPEGRTYAAVIAETMIVAAANGSVAAAMMIADRTEGRPRQAVDLSLNQTEFDRYQRMVDDLIERAAERGIIVTEEQAIDELGKIDERIHEVFAVAAVSGRVH